MQATGIRKDDHGSDAGGVLPSENAVIARTQAELYGFLARVFNHRPDLAFASSLKGPGAEFLKQLAEESEIPAGVSLGWREMAAYVDTQAGKSDAELEQALAVDWTRLFRGLSPQFGPTPPYEAAYLPHGKRDAEYLQALVRFYQESGVSIDEDHHDRPDYIGLEIGFLCHLAQAEADAWERGDPEQAQLCRARSQAFLTEHLGLWAARYLKVALDHAQTGFYRGFIDVCAGLLPDLQEDTL